MACSVLEHVHNLCTCSTGGRNIIEQIHVRNNLVNLLTVHSVSKIVSNYVQDRFVLQAQGIITR